MTKLINFFTRHDKTVRDNYWIFGSMLIGAVLSLLASFVLSIEAVQLAENPNAALACNLNLVFNCTTVGVHASAHMFNFPNSFLGLIAEPVVITVAIAGLSGVKFPRPFMFAAQIGYSLGFIFALILLYLSMFVIQALCPWCLLVTLTTTLVFFAMTRYNIRENNLYLPKKIQQKFETFISKGYDKLLLCTFFVVIVAGIIVKYGNALFTF